MHNVYILTVSKLSLDTVFLLLLVLVLHTRSRTVLRFEGGQQLRVTTERCHSTQFSNIFDFSLGTRIESASPSLVVLIKMLDLSENSQ